MIFLIIDRFSCSSITGAYGGFAPNAGFNGGFNRLGIDQQYQGGYQPGGIY